VDRKKLLVRVLLAAWVFIWALFLIRPYIKKDLVAGYRELVGSTLEAKHAWVTGKALYEFIQACKTSVPSGSTYSLVGLDHDPLSKERAAYYLYPNTPSAYPDFLFVYKLKDFSRSSYMQFKDLGSDNFVFKKRTQNG
jgi:hypothetical protein